MNIISFLTNHKHYCGYRIFSPWLTRLREKPLGYLLILSNPVKVFFTYLRPSLSFRALLQGSAI